MLNTFPSCKNTMATLSNVTNCQAMAPAPGDVRPAEGNPARR